MSFVEPLNAKKKTGLRIIAYLKLVSAVLLLTLTFGIFHLMGGDIGNKLDHYVRMMNIDTDNKMITRLLAKLSGISPKQLKRVGAVTFIYAVLYIIEGIGLLMAKHWAEYLTIFITAALIPVEVYEVLQKASTARITILIINSLIVGYLIYRLRAEKAQAMHHLNTDEKET